MVKKELSQRVKLLIYQFIDIHPLTSEHELWAVTKKTRLQIQVTEMSFLDLRDKLEKLTTAREAFAETSQPTSQFRIMRKKKKEKK